MRQQSPRVLFSRTTRTVKDPLASAPKPQGPTRTNPARAFRSSPGFEQFVCAVAHTHCSLTGVIFGHVRLFPQIGNIPIRSQFVCARSMGGGTWPIAVDVRIAMIR